MRSLFFGLAAASLLAGTSMAQVAPTRGPNSNATGPTVGHDTASAPSTGASKTTTGGPVNDQTASGKNAAGGDNNQAVATTNANANQPAKGSNSFTEGQAKSRLESNGFNNVSDLKKDNDGIWRGTATTKAGEKTNVWLDYKGNAGATQQSAGR